MLKKMMVFTAGWVIFITCLLLAISYSNPTILFYGAIILIFFSCLAFITWIYRSPANSIVPIFRFGKFRTFLGPSETVVLLPIDLPLSPIGLQMRPTHLLETELLTRDRKFVEAQIHVFFSVDPRRADISYLADELQYKDDQWETIVKREMQSALFEVMRGFTSNELLTNVGLRDLREELSNNLSENLADLGIAVHPTHGVRIMRLLPHRKVMQAMIELEAADILGDAALCRMQPLLNAVGPVPAQGWQALLVTMASAIVNHEDPQKLEAAPKFAKTVGEVKDGNSPGGTPSPSRN